MKDKQQLAAIGEHMAGQAAQPLCMAKRIEALEAQARVMAELLREAAPMISGYGISIHNEAHRDEDYAESERAFDLEERIYAVLAGNLPSATVPEGWQLVPVEPTESMIGHGCGASVMVVSEVVTAWAAMLAAAPKPEAK